MYSPTLGRWIQNDPIGFQAGDENLYRFVGNDPAGLVDPSGLAKECPFPMRTGEMTDPIENEKCNPFLDRSGLVDPPSRFDLLRNIECEPNKPLPKGARLGPGSNVSAGTHRFFGPVDQYIGTGGAETCVGVIVISGCNSAVFHFYNDDSSKHTLAKYKWPKNSRAIVFGGNEEKVSRFALSETLSYLRNNRIPTTCIRDSDSVWLNTSQFPHVRNR